MNGDEVLRLIDAGFTADEIRAMGKGSEEKDPPAGDDKKDPEKGTPDKGDEVEKKSEVDALTAEVSKLTETVKAMQEQNIKKANSGTGSVDDPVKKAIDGFLKEL